jgi:hypothetical protein
MRRQSYLGELEVLYCYALRCPSFKVGDGNTFLQVMLEYVDLFFDKADVVRDLSDYVTLLNHPADTQVIKNRLGDRIKQAESQVVEIKPQKSYSNDPNQQMHVLTSMKVLRYSYVYHKMMRLIGIYNQIDETERLKTVNKIVSIFL